MSAATFTNITCNRLLTTGHEGVNTRSIRAAECTSGASLAVVTTWRLMEARYGRGPWTVQYTIGCRKKRTRALETVEIIITLI